MKDLLRVIEIFLQYGDPECPTHCEHDVMQVCIDPADVSEEDLKELDELGFFPDSEEDDCFRSYRFGSA